jgi:hypothetical protein
VPHIWLADGSALQDQLGRRYTLLHRGGADADSVEALAAAFAQTGAPFATCAVDSGAAEVVFEGHELVLVRPDLHVMWRGTADELAPESVALVATGRLTAAGDRVR